MLPTDWSSFPFTYTNEDMSWLEGSTVKEHTYIMQQAMLRQYILISDNIPDFRSKFSFFEFSKMYRVGTSRTFKLMMGSNKDEESTCYIPYVDLFNH